jgi:membrane protein
VVVLVGAVVAAHAPVLLRQAQPRAGGPGGRFALALELVGLLAQARGSADRGLTLAGLARQAGCDTLDVEPLVDLLVELGWAARLDEESPARCVLLADPASTPAAPLADRLLMAPWAAAQRFRQAAGLEQATLAQWLAGTPART